MKKVKVAALIGKGGRLPAIWKCCQRDRLLELVVVISHKKKSPGIEWAKKRGIESFYFRWTDFKKEGKSRQDFDLALAKVLKDRKIDLVVCAGWDLLLGKEFLKRFKNKTINIHPSLCPAFPGMEAEKQALEYGVKITGCTLHFVDEGVDTGPIILQKAVRLESGETLKSLQKKIHSAEEKILYRGMKLFARGKLEIRNRKVMIK